jgi:chromosomal replication initiation ATPase DnaA
MPQQLPLDLPLRPALGRDAYIVSDSNAMAVAAVDDVTGWPNGKMVLCGAPSSGKTHLAHVWAHDNDATIIASKDLKEPDLPDLATGSLVVEDIHLIAGDRAAETLVFHLHNMILAEQHPVLFTSATPPARLDIELPDLKSRLEGTSLVSLEAIDDMLLTLLLVKLFGDRQLKIKPTMLDYTVPRLPRSFAAVHSFVAQMDTRALAQRRDPGRKLAGEVLADMASIYKSNINPA